MTVLAQKQQSIFHWVKEVLTILNMSRNHFFFFFFQKNRHTITELITALQQTDEKLRRISCIRKTNKRITTIHWCVLEIRFNNRRIKANDTTRYVLLQLNLLSIGRLSPSVILPSNLRQLLRSMSRRDCLRR